MRLQAPAIESAIAVVRKIDTSGHAPLRIITSNYDEYIVKNSRGNVPSQALIGELVSSYLLKVWNIATPPIALVTVPSEILDDSIRRHPLHKAQYYKHSCFGSRVVNNATDLNRFMEFKSKISYNEFLNPLDLLRIGLFDLWIENHDRHSGNMNLLLHSTESGNTVYAIDHAQVFQAGCIEILDPKQCIMVSQNESLLSASICKNVYRRIASKRAYLREVNESFLSCVEDSVSLLPEIGSFIPPEYGFTPELQQRVASFLSNEKRNRSVFSTFSEFIRR